MCDLFNKLGKNRNMYEAQGQVAMHQQSNLVSNSPQPRPSEVEQQMARLDALIDGLSKQCGELLNRLDPVLRRQNGVSQPDTDGKPVEAIVPLAARMRDSADLLDNISSGIERMINSIEL